MTESIFSLGSNESEDILQNFQIIAHFGRITIPLLTARYFFTHQPLQHCGNF